MKKWKLWGGLLTLFLSGVFLGVVGTWMVADTLLIESLHEGRPGIQKIITRQLGRELDLSAHQRERLEKIVCRTHQELMELRDLHKPEKDRILQRTVEQIKAELLPEQQKKFDAFHEKMKERRAKRERAGRGPHGEPGPCD